MGRFHLSPYVFHSSSLDFFSLFQVQAAYGELKCGHWHDNEVQLEGLVSVSPVCSLGNFLFATYPYNMQELKYLLSFHIKPLPITMKKLWV